MLSDEEYQERIQKLKNRNLKELYFIHIPKAAGSYVRHFPIPISAHGNHEQFHSYPAYENVDREGMARVLNKDLLEKGEIVSGYIVGEQKPIKPSILRFATVRNPFDYLISCYFSGMVGAPGQTIRCAADHKDSRIHCTRCNGLGYEKFLTEYCKDQMLYLPCRKNLFHQIFDNKGRCCVDLLIRSEYIHNGLVQLNNIVFDKKVDRNISKSHINVSLKRQKRNYKEFYTEEIKQMVEKKVKKELDMFGYSFDGPVDKRPFVFLDRDKRYDIF